MFNSQDNQTPISPLPGGASSTDIGQPFELTPAPSQSISSAGNDDLLGIKAQALQSLTPLVDKLDQTPEDKFKTTMMLIQASDNASLIKRAYEAASQIEDEKNRAQAMIDIINEINYFTHPEVKS